MKLLAIDTASAQCSVALGLGTRVLVRDVATAREHAQRVLPMVQALLAEAGTSLRALDGIAFGRGPGSFTGVRIAAAVTQGLALGADLPVLPVSDLRALAAQAVRLATEGGSQAPQHALACMDARMGEVYWGWFEVDPVTAVCAPGDEHVGPPGQVHALPGVLRAAAAGRGLSAWPRIAELLQLAPQACFGEAEPHALDVLRLARADLAAGVPWQDAAHAQPVYLRDRVIQSAR